ncbi:hypothetical protein SDC9_78123 [bioreactor metagenome]|uniref:ECF RNA polymerase sigma factor SigW n=1 Tax=bioreactor metagenome TaxID=1076179 RepID=A0A644YTC8_9ZZZZ
MKSSNLNEPIEKLFNDNYAVLVIYASRFVNSRPQAEDIVQEVFTKIWESSSEKKCSKSYLFAAVHNTAINASKAKSNNNLKLETTNLSSSEIEDELSDKLIEDIEREHAILKALKKLPPRTLAVIKKIYMEEMSYKEAADSLGMSGGTIKTHMFRAMRDLRKYLKLFVMILAVIIVYYIKDNNIHDTGGEQFSEQSRYQKGFRADRSV